MDSKSFKAKARYSASVINSSPEDRYSSSDSREEVRFGLIPQLINPTIETSMSGSLKNCIGKSMRIIY